MKKQSNPPPPKDVKRPKAPVGPPTSSFNWCNVFGHKMRTLMDNIAGPHRCIRKNCDHTEPRVEWPTSTVTVDEIIALDEAAKRVGCNFPEDSEQENGNYSNICGDCKTPFIGNKDRRRCKVCRDCAELSGHSWTPEPHPPLPVIDYGWTPVDQHDTIGWCWIKYKGRVRHAWHKGGRWFMFSEHGMTGCYMTECISGVIAIEVPTL